MIRQRGQLTIPDEIRELHPWLAPNSVVTISPVSAEAVVVKPFNDRADQKVDWKKIWDGIRLARSFKGKRGNLSSFVVKDRESHF